MWKSSIAIVVVLCLTVSCNKQPDGATGKSQPEDASGKSTSALGEVVQEDGKAVHEKVVDVAGIQWAADFESARNQAEKQDRPVIAYFTFDG